MGQEGARIIAGALEQNITLKELIVISETPRCSCCRRLRCFLSIHLSVKPMCFPVQIVGWGLRALVMYLTHSSAIPRSPRCTLDVGPLLPLVPQHVILGVLLSLMC